MASAATIRSAVGTRLRTIAGLTVHNQVPDFGQLNPPCALIMPTRAEPEQVLGRTEMVMWNVDVMVLVPGSAGRIVAQEKLDAYTATSSTGGVYGAIAADRTLGGTVASTFIRSIGDIGDVELGDVTLAGFTVSLEVWAS